jgi:hypothetical protein
MVSALLNDALSNPSAVLLSLHHDQTSSSSSQRFASRVAQHFKSIFKDDDAFKQVRRLLLQSSPTSSHNGEIYRFL